jgi:glycosyltransferase involved in cell wall biosynthesis
LVWHLPQKPVRADPEGVATMVATEQQRVSVGLPTYNRPDGLAATLDCLTAQSHRDIDILVSDNCSTDPRVQAVILDFAARDTRIRHQRHATNLGAAANFKSVLDASTSPLFMWASDDDLWEPNFVAANLALLAADPDCQMAFSSIDNINARGVKIRDYPGFSRLTSGSTRRNDAARFILEPEILGKANLIYGLYRTAPLQQLAAELWDKIEFLSWGGDMVLLYAFIARHRIVASDEILLHKRMPVASNEPIGIGNPRSYFVPSRHYRSFVARHKAVAPDADFAADVVRLMRRRRWQQATSQLAGLVTGNRTKKG